MCKFTIERFALVQKTVAEHAFDDCFNMANYISLVPPLKLGNKGFTALCLAGFSTAYALSEADPSYLPTADNLVGYHLHTKLTEARYHFYKLQGQKCQESNNPITVDFFIHHASKWLEIPYSIDLWSVFRWPKPFGYLYDHFGKARSKIQRLYLASRAQSLYKVSELPDTYFRALAGCLALQIYMESKVIKSKLAEDWSTRVDNLNCTEGLALAFTRYLLFIDKFESMAANTPGAGSFLVK